MSNACARGLDSAKRLVEALRDEDLVAAFVFGSVAWGDADDASDVDIMLLLDRDDDFREVRRIRVRDVVPDAAASPVFADVDSFAFDRFRSAVEQGRWVNKVAQSIILIDDGRFGEIHEIVNARFFSRDARAERAQVRIDATDRYVKVAECSVDNNAELALLNARLAAEQAGIAALEASGSRLSTAHYLQNLEGAFVALGEPEMMPRLHSALDVTGGIAGAYRGLQAYKMMAETLRHWMTEPGLVKALGPENVAWAEMTYSAESYDEFAIKIVALRDAGREPEAVAYADGLLRIGIRMNLSKVLSFRDHGTVDIMSITDFHSALRAEPALYDEWVAGQRLNGDRDDVRMAIDVAGEVVATVPMLSSLPVPAGT